MLFELQDLIQPVPDLESLVMPVSMEEINNIVRCMPPDKAPGPDGFNGLFMKKCWHFIKPDFYELC
jgi:hypothetical protein